MEPAGPHQGEVLDPILGERDELREVLAHPGAIGGRDGAPGPATRRPIASARSQSAKRAAWDPIDQSTWVASIRTG